MLLLIRDRIVSERGYMNLFFTPEWEPVLYRDSTASVREEHYEIDHVSFGHDVETAFLMLEASEALGLPVEDRTLPVARRMVDHALDTGFDHQVGGFYDRGYYMPDADTLTVILPTKNWWAQAEGLHTLLIMADLFPDDPRDYAALFRKQWEYVDRYLMDHVHGGWYSGGLDREPERKAMAKAHQWKASYHDGRALMRVLDRLRAR
jgi:mannobiose 2-epimerase